MNIEVANFNSKNRDWFMLSKGHAALALYVTLSKFGFFKRSFLEKEYLKNGGLFGGHPDRMLNYGVEISSGSLGHGLSIAAGYAFAAKKDNINNKTFVLLGDGECNEGMVWEAVMFASHHKLDNLIAIIDYNNLQGLGYVNDVLNIAPLSDKFESFGWSVNNIDGHDIDSIMQTTKKLPFHKNKPNVIIAKTIKGKGASILENRIDSHYQILDKDKYHNIIEELRSEKY